MGKAASFALKQIIIKQGCWKNNCAITQGDKNVGNCGHKMQDLTISEAWKTVLYWVIPSLVLVMLASGSGFLDFGVGVLSRKLGPSVHTAKL